MNVAPDAVHGLQRLSPHPNSQMQATDAREPSLSLQSCSTQLPFGSSMDSISAPRSMTGGESRFIIDHEMIDASSLSGGSSPVTLPDHPAAMHTSPPAAMRALTPAAGTRLSSSLLTQQLRSPVSVKRPVEPLPPAAVMPDAQRPAVQRVVRHIDGESSARSISQIDGPFQTLLRTEQQKNDARSVHDNGYVAGTALYETSRQYLRYIVDCLRNPEFVHHLTDSIESEYGRHAISDDEKHELANNVDFVWLLDGRFRMPSLANLARHLPEASFIRRMRANNTLEPALEDERLGLLREMLRFSFDSEPQHISEDELAHTVEQLTGAYPSSQHLLEFIAGVWRKNDARSVLAGSTRDAVGFLRTMFKHVPMELRELKALLPDGGSSPFVARVEQTIGRDVWDPGDPTSKARRWKMLPESAYAVAKKTFKMTPDEPNG